MSKLLKYTFLFVLFSFLVYWELSLHIPDFSLKILYQSLFEYDPLRQSEVLIREFRIPRLVIAIVAGSGLSIAGMLMQTLFQNPLAGPYVLGINSGSNLFVGLFLLTGYTFFQLDFGLVSSAITGALVFGFIILLFARFIKQNVSLLLIGLMIASFTSALLTVIENTSSASALKSFVVWGMGSLQNVSFEQLGLILILFSLGVFLSFFLIKPLNALVLGEQAARNLGVRVGAVRMNIILITALFSGLITAFCGPIAFVGLTVPNLSRMLFRTQNHFQLIWANLLIGALFLLMCDVLSIYLENYIILPVNAITALFGAPMVIFFIIKSGKV